MFGLGTTELIIIGVIVFIIFGAKRIPEIGKGLGGALREFKQIKKDIGPEETSDHAEEKERAQGEKATPALEDKLVEKAVEQVPVVKKAMDLKKKVEKVKDIIK
ncbi:MAG: twin-arginine translocase TatA/TatE family subunit [Desulfatiglandales bacterium]